MERVREQHKSNHRAGADATADESVEHGGDGTELERELDELLDEVDCRPRGERGGVRQGVHPEGRRVGSAIAEPGRSRLAFERPSGAYSVLGTGVGGRAVTEEAVQRAEPTRRRATAYLRWNLIVLCVAIAVLATTILVARHELAALEVRIFRAVNELPQGLHTVVWPFMQYGTFITIPALAVVAFLFRRFRLALAIVLAGVGVYLVALVVKDFVERGRPAALITAVEERELFGADSLGYPSGHAAVAAALTVVVAAHLSVRWVIAALALGAIVLFGRIYVGAHLPLDVIGGAALGAIAGSVVNLVVRPRALAPTS